MEYSIYNLSGINTYINPFSRKDGELIRAVNVVGEPFGALSKRPGYTASLDNPDASVVNNLFSWQKNDGTSIFLYRMSGSVLYFYDAAIGTAGNWTPCGNGTFSANAQVGNAILEDTLIVGDGVSETRHTTNGTTFTNTSLAPVAQHFAEYQNRIYAAGTASTLFYSTTGDATDWSTVSPSDSSSFNIPGAGRLNGLFKQNDRLYASKNSSLMFRYDGFSLVDLATDLGPSSIRSLAKVEDYSFWFNRLGVYGFGGNSPELISNPIQNFIYNNDETGVVGSQFDVAAGVAHRYRYYTSLGSITDDFTKQNIPKAVSVYDFQQNQFTMYDFADLPTAYLSYKDRNLSQQLVFGDGFGQCFLFGGTATTDAGNAIFSEVIFLIHANRPQDDKDWKKLGFHFNPGCQAQVLVAASNNYSLPNLNWQSVGDVSSGYTEYKPKSGLRGTFLYVKIQESSTNSRWTFYGMDVSADVVPGRT